jgi:hypothetical protein
MPDFADLLTMTCAVYRPFGAGTPTATGVACRLVPSLERGQRTTHQLQWTHVLELAADAEVRDGITRSGGNLVYADGDEVRVPDATGERFVVVWVEVYDAGLPSERQRAYLLRDTGRS